MKTKEKKLTQANVYISKDVWDKFRALTMKQGHRRFSPIVEKLLRQYIEENDDK